MPQSIVVRALRDAIEAARKDLKEEPCPEMADSLLKLVAMYQERSSLPTTGDLKRLKDEVKALTAKHDQLEAKMKRWEENLEARQRSLGSMLGIRR